MVCVEYLFIAITLRSTLTWSRSTCYGQIDLFKIYSYSIKPYTKIFLKKQQHKNECTMKVIP